jgi:hypothetical protein
LDIHTLSSRTEKQTDQTNSQGRHEHEQVFLELPKRAVVSLAKVRGALKSGQGVSTSGRSGAWTRATRLLMLTWHGAFSKLSLDNSEDMLHAPFQLRLARLMAQKSPFLTKNQGKRLH